MRHTTTTEKSDDTLRWYFLYLTWLFFFFFFLFAIFFPPFSSCDLKKLQTTKREGSKSRELRRRTIIWRQTDTVDHKDILR